MSDGPVDAAKLAALATLTDEQLGITEEDAKIRFAVPLLEALCHTRLAFEHKGKDILLRDGLPRAAVGGSGPQIGTGPDRPQEETR